MRRLATSLMALVLLVGCEGAATTDPPPSPATGASPTAEPPPPPLTARHARQVLREIPAPPGFARSLTCLGEGRRKGCHHPARARWTATIELKGDRYRGADDEREREWLLLSVLRTPRAGVAREGLRDWRRGLEVGRLRQESRDDPDRPNWYFFGYTGRARLEPVAAHGWRGARVVRHLRYQRRGVGVQDVPMVEVWAMVRRGPDLVQLYGSWRDRPFERSAPRVAAAQLDRLLAMLEDR